VRRARLDPELGVRVVGARALRYDRPAEAHDDRPDHVRAASGLAVHSGQLVIVQDDASFFAVLGDDGVGALKLPRGLQGRRRFEVALGNKLDKLDLESAVTIGDELWAFGSGSLPIREKICRVHQSIPRVIDAAPFYARMREALGSALNIEGAACVRERLWLFHRGNTGLADVGPAVIVVPIDGLRAWLEGRGGMPPIEDVDSYDLGAVGGRALGFTDAVAFADRVLYVATAEATANAIDDGAILGSQLGVIGRDGVRAAPLAGPDGEAVKAEGLALDPARPGHAWIALDPDDPDQPATLLDVELTGPW